MTCCKTNEPTNHLTCVSEIGFGVNVYKNVNNFDSLSSQSDSV